MEQKMRLSWWTNTWSQSYSNKNNFFRSLPNWRRRRRESPKLHIFDAFFACLPAILPFLRRLFGIILFFFDIQSHKIIFTKKFKQSQIQKKTYSLHRLQVWLWDDGCLLEDTYALRRYFSVSFFSFCIEEFIEWNLY